jgi:hypothetical protein
MISEGEKELMKNKKELTKRVRGMFANTSQKAYCCDGRLKHIIETLQSFGRL